MFFEHTHLHQRQFQNSGEYLEMSLTGGIGLEGQGLFFVNDDHRMTSDEIHQRHIMRARFGVFDELQRRGIKDFVINMPTCRYLDTTSPEWLFEVVARRCVINGLDNPETAQSFFSGKTPRPKDKNLLASIGSDTRNDNDRTRASLYVDDVGRSPSQDFQTVMSWLQKWRGEVTVAGYSSGGWEHYLDVEGARPALDELPSRVFTSSNWTWKNGESWDADVSPMAGYLTEWTLNALYQTGLNP
ncbi:hypothetical protein [Ascidiaceihabitans sp.]|uniref:hypothetical protein n=1 Tax=Ascidiaceihabitans sp. TaxID=1872644 RepID=UPI0032976246